MKCPLNIWQQESVTATALAEAAEHGCSLLSFKSEKYTDCVLDIQKGSQKYEVLSIYSPRYLAQNHYIDLNIDRCDYLKIRYEGTRIDCSLLVRISLKKANISSY
mgnify:CR=1 FL=1